MFSIFYVYSLTCTKHKNRYKRSKLITIVKKKKRMKGWSSHEELKLEMWVYRKVWDELGGPINSRMSYDKTENKEKVGFIKEECETGHLC